jgi:hypothetical protein
MLEWNEGVFKKIVLNKILWVSIIQMLIFVILR